MIKVSLLGYIKIYNTLLVQVVDNIIKNAKVLENFVDNTLMYPQEL